MSRRTPRQEAEARELAQGAAERMGPAALAMLDAPDALIRSYGIDRTTAIAIINAERAKRARVWP
jgi:hypothetical protein